MSALPKWDLSDLYSSTKDPKIEADLKTIDTLIQAFKNNYQNKVKDLTAEALLKAVKDYESLDDLAGKLMSYASLVHAEDMTNEETSNLYQNINEKINELFNQIMFFTLDIKKLEDSHLEPMFANQELNFYKPWFVDLREAKKYQLSDDLELLLSEKSLTSHDGWIRVFDETLAGLKFDYRDQQVPISDVLHHLSSIDGQERKDAAKSIGKTLGENAKTFAMVTNTLAKDKQISDNWRKFKEPISSRNLANLIEDDVVENLIKTVKDHYPKLSHRYYEFKAKEFGVETLNYWDRNAPYPDMQEQHFTWDEGKKLVLEAYNEFCPQMAEIGEEFFDKNWIHAIPQAGKDSGAFAHPVVPSAHPYLLVNYYGRARDVATLAHELGHGVHQMLARKQGALICHAPLTLAETASVFGEQIVFQKILAKEKDEKQKKYLIAGKVEDMLNTVVRQIAFCDFEKHIHAERKNGEVPLDRICELWLQVQRESLGKSVRFDDEYKFYWCYISHFIHAPFYVYAYAFGDCLVNSLYQTFSDEPKGFSDKYITMLEQGGRLRHKELLKPFGLDTTKPDFWAQGLKMIEGMIRQLQ